MGTVGIVVISDLVTLVLSLGATLISIGIKWGKITTDVTHMKRDLAEIKGMFVLKIRELRWPGMARLAVYAAWGLSIGFLVAVGILLASGLNPVDVYHGFMGLP